MPVAKHRVQLAAMLALDGVQSEAAGPTSLTSVNHFVP
jgi:hypothetical protein